MLFTTKTLAESSLIEYLHLLRFLMHSRRLHHSIRLFSLCLDQLLNVVFFLVVRSLKLRFYVQVGVHH
jgi:hypothetical protein